MVQWSSEFKSDPSLGIMKESYDLLKSQSKEPEVDILADLPSARSVA